jgi:signal recognition particle subunit SRP54
MFESLTDRLARTFRNLTGKGRLKEEHIKETLREVRKALLDADVALPVVKDFIHSVQGKSIGKDLSGELSPAQFFVKIVHDELVQIMGEENKTLNLNATPPAVILMSGLQGSGKTTMVGKLGKWLKETHNKSVMVVSCDIYRPAAIQQLKTLAEAAGVAFYESEPSQKPLNIVEGALLQAKKQAMDVLIIDTAGRLHIDEPMMSELKMLHAAVKPVETLFVVDSMTGQDAANTAKTFNEALPLTGVILTKTDGDSRGGAALSIRAITGKPIKFMGIGEKIEALEPFYPDRLASRILGMGDLRSLLEEAERKVDKQKAEKLAKKLQKGQGFDLADLRDQMKEMLKMGGMASVMDKLPGMGGLAQELKSKVNDKEIIRSIAIMDSMTLSERHSPALIAHSGSRKRRIAQGAGVNLQDVNRVLKQHEQMQKKMKQFSDKGLMSRMMQGLKAGGVPPGLFS